MRDLPGPMRFGWVVNGGLLACIGWLLLLCLVILVVYLVSARPNRRRDVSSATPPLPPSPRRAPDALDAARMRYARGEIGREEYLQIRDDLERPG